MVCQFSLYGSNNYMHVLVLFFQPNNESERAHQQHIQNKTTTFLSIEKPTFENEKILNSCNKREDGKAITKYDPIWLDTTYSIENYSDENES